MRLPGHQKRGGALLLLLLTTVGFAHVASKTGEPLQFYSYYTTTPPLINSSLTDRTNPYATVTPGANNDEWKDAAVRQIEIISLDGTDTIEASLFFMNDADNLYVGMTTNFGNSSNATYIELLFDQGIGGGDHNDVLEGAGVGANNGEYAARVYPNNGNKSELSFNGTAWVPQNIAGEVFEGYGGNFGTSFIQAEYKIPLHPGNPVGDGQSYLDIDSLGELGLFISFYSQGGGKYYTWRETNGDVNNAGTAPGWMDLKLGVPRQFTTFFTTFNANGNPVVDGNILSGTTPDDAWRGSYRRDILLTDFDGNTIKATVYGTEDNAAQHAFVGVKVEDQEQNAGDFLEIYQEQDNTPRPNTGRDYLLESTFENSLRANTSPMVLANDRHWDGGTETWVADAVNAEQSAVGTWYPTQSYYEYEFQLDRNGDAQDMSIDDGKRVGFLIRYHDEATNSDYFWEFTPNKDAIELDLNANIFTSAGWAELQFGAPYVQVIFPEDDKEVHGNINLRIYAEDENADGIASATFYRASSPTQITPLIRINGTNEWSSTWNTLSLPDGPDTLVVSVTDDDGITIDRLVYVTINNTGGSFILPTVSITTPEPSDTLFGDTSLTFSTTLGSAGALTELTLFIDGDSIALPLNATSYALNTTQWGDGEHSVQLRVTNDENRTVITPVTIYYFQNGPSVTITAPTAGIALRNTFNVTFNDTTPSPTSSIVKREVSLDGGAWDTLGVTDSSYAMNTASWENGTHTVAIRVTDDRGRKATSDSRLFVVDNQTPLLADPKVLYPQGVVAHKQGDTLIITALVRDVHAGLATDSAVLFNSNDVDTLPVTVVMVDDGTAGDQVANDNIFTAQVIPTTTVDTVTFTVTAEDILGNSKTVTSRFTLDNTDPVVGMITFVPNPTTVGTSRQLYDEFILIKGTYRDAGGAGLARVYIEQVNDSGDHINNSPLDLSVDDSLYSRSMRLIPGMNILSLTAIDKAGNSVTTRDTVVYIEPKASANIGVDGGTVSSPNGVSVVIPADALLKTKEITITRVSAWDEPAPENTGIVLLNVAHDFSPDGLIFRKDVTITLTYSEANLDLDQDGVAEVNPLDLSIVFWDGKVWRTAGVSTVDTATKSVSVKVNHFTMYDLAVVADDTPTEVYGYWEKNPVSATKGGLFSYRVPADGQVSLYVLDMSGDMVYQLIPQKTDVTTGVYSIAWKGQNVAEQFAGAGLYIYVFTYESADGSVKKVVRKPVGLVK